MDDYLISVDIEAGGPVPGLYPMLSIGACPVEDTGTRFYVELKPVPADRFEEGAVSVGWPDQPASATIANLTEHGLPPRDAMAKFEEWVNHVSAGGRPVYLAFNASFDWMFTHYYFEAYLGRDPFGIGAMDVKAYWAGKNQCVWSQTSKSRLPSRLSEGLPEHTHRADEDAARQAAIFLRMRDDGR